MLPLEVGHKPIGIQNFCRASELWTYDTRAVKYQNA